jgi:N-dimethylarginine dimethylaminohydrolase
MPSLASKKKLLMSYPGPAWRILGAQNFRSQSREGTDPRAALSEWLQFAELLAAKGATIAPLSPPLVEPPLTGLLYAANHGALFPRPGRAPVFLVGRLSVAHRVAEASVVRAHAELLGFEVEHARALWEGQAEICALPGARFVLTFGVRSDRASVDEVGARLPAGARVLVAEIRAPFFHGDTCLDAIEIAGGHTALLCHEGALVDKTLADVERFCAPDVEVIPVDERDALAYACNALSVGTDLVAAPGLSQPLRDVLSARGVRLVETAMTELFGKGGGGPRCLVNDLGALAGEEDLRTFDARLPTSQQWLAALRGSLSGYPHSLA